ncbi:MAG: cell division protein SepF [Actinobacteria bacterium]|nr:cell division protein SepF [Actinomycetota bacterium]
MPGMWKKTLSYLGLVEDEEYEELDEVAGGETYHAEPSPVRRLPRPQAVRSAPVADPRSGGEAIVRTIAPVRPTPGSQIHRAEPKRFNEAREVGDRFKEGVPVIMNLQGTEDSIARRLVDFASGLVYGLDGKIEMVAGRVYLLTPADVEVSAEERERLRDGGLYNQF